MKLPSRIVDLSSPLENETVYDPPFMRPKIQYVSNAETAPLLAELFPGLREEDLPDGEGWAIEQIALTTHNGTHMDAPIHFQSKTIDGKPMMTIDQVPLDWFFRPGVKLDFRKVPDGHVVTAAEVEAELKRVGHELQAVRHCSGQYARIELHWHRRISHRWLRHGARSDALSDVARRARHRHRCLGLGRAVRPHTRERWLKTHDPSIIWEGHKAGREIPYCHMEKLCNLEQLPDHGFTVACFPYKVKAGSAGWTRAVAMFD